MLVSMPTATNTTVGSSASQFHLPNNLNNLSSSSSSSGVLAKKTFFLQN
jgi:hypothetical protein